ncbi:MAG: tetratricopeptide repeat protein, partial [Chthoniobacterales bacterium]
GEQVRVNVQLLDARNVAHVWAESFDRKLTDMFAVESEVAEKIANTLQARLTGEEQQALAVTPTRSDAAYDAYLRGLAYERLAAVAPEIFETAIGFYNEAVRLDPQFAVAWAHLAMVQSAMYHFGFDHTPMRLEAMKRAAETAMKLQPNLGESLLAWGFYQYRGTQDYFAADKAFDDARQRLPNDAWTVECGSFVKRRQGKWDQAIALLEKVMQLDPRNAQLHSELRYTISQAEGDLDGADRALASQPLQPGNPTVFTTQMTQLLFRRNFGQAISALSAALQFPDNSLGGQLGEYYVILSLAQHASGDEAGARATCEQGIAYLDQIRATNADTWFVSACFGLLRAGLGDEAGAMREGEHSFALTAPMCPRARMSKKQSRA